MGDIRDEIYSAVLSNLKFSIKDTILAVGNAKQSEELTARLEALIKDYLNNPDDRTCYDKLATVYWEMFFYLMDAKLNIPIHESLTFSLPEILMIDFGIIDKRLLGEEFSITNNIILQIDQNYLIGDFKVKRVTDWIKETYLEVYGISKEKYLEKQVAVLKQDLAELESSIENAKKERNRVAEHTRQVFPRFNNLINCYRKADEYLLTYSEITKRIKSGGEALSSDDRQKYADMDKIMKGNQTDTDYLLNDLFNVSPERATNLKMLEESIEKDVNRLIDLNQKVNSIHREYQSAKGAKEKGEIKSDRKAEMINELRRFRTMKDLASRRGNVSSSPLLSAEKRLLMKTGIVDIIAEAETADPKIFENRKANKFGRPDIVIVMGSGDGIFDWERNAFIVPLQYGKTPQEAILRAIVEYRWDNDTDKILQTGYSELKENKGLTLSKLQANLLKDYIGWIMKESRGYKVLPKEVRVWFERNIAPKKSDKEKYDKEKLEREGKVQPEEPAVTPAVNIEMSIPLTSAFEPVDAKIDPHIIASSVKQEIKGKLQYLKTENFRLEVYELGGEEFVDISVKELKLNDLGAVLEALKRFL